MTVKTSARSSQCAVSTTLAHADILRRSGGPMSWLSTNLLCCRSPSVRLPFASFMNCELIFRICPFCALTCLYFGTDATPRSSMIKMRLAVKFYGLRIAAVSPPRPIYCSALEINAWLTPSKRSEDTAEITKFNTILCGRMEEMPTLMDTWENTFWAENFLYWIAFLV